MQLSNGGSSGQQKELMNVTKPTFTHLVNKRNLLVSKGFGEPGRLTSFIPNNRHEAKATIRRGDFGLFLDHYDGKRRSDWQNYLESKIKRVGGDFKHSYTNEQLRQELK